eukprot:SAG31_NODE_22157_length_532_cov_1.161663_1_plen_47_part_01
MQSSLAVTWYSCEKLTASSLAESLFERGSLQPRLGLRQVLTGKFVQT